MREHHRIWPALRDPSRSHKLKAQTKDREARLLTLSQRASCVEHLKTQGISHQGAAPVRLRRGAIRQSPGASAPASGFHQPRLPHRRPRGSRGGAVALAFRQHQRSGVRISPGALAGLPALMAVRPLGHKGSRARAHRRRRRRRSTACLGRAHPRWNLPASPTSDARADEQYSVVRSDPGPAPKVGSLEPFTACLSQRSVEQLVGFSKASRPNQSGPAPVRQFHASGGSDEHRHRHSHCRCATQHRDQGASKASNRLVLLVER